MSGVSLLPMNLNIRHSYRELRSSQLLFSSFYQIKNQQAENKKCRQLRPGALIRSDPTTV